MIDIDKKRERELSKERQRRRMHVTVDENNYEYTPADKQTDYYDNDVHQRVAIYVRVSTDDERQTTSFELQQIYYEDFVSRHPNWTLVKIYADMYNQRLIQCHAHGSVEKCLKQRLSADLNVLLKAFFFVCSVFDVEAV